MQIKTILKIPGHIALEQVDIWLEDEARFGQQNTTTRLWAETGSRPRAVKQQQFEYAYLFGSACVTDGNSEALVVPYVNKEVMTMHLQQVSAKTAIDRHAVSAGWHTDDIASEFDNITIIKFQPTNLN